MIAENIKQVLSELPEGVRLVAVSKFHPNEAIEEAYNAGQRVFGESKVQEMTAKYERHNGRLQASSQGRTNGKLPAPTAHCTRRN